MRIDIQDMDLKPGTIARALVEALLGKNWEDYVIVYVGEYDYPTGVFFSKYKLHNDIGPAAVKRDGSMEWWLNGEKLFCQTQKEFESYMKNKAFW